MIYVAYYFIAGLMAIILLNRNNGKILGRIKDGSYDTQTKLMTGAKTSIFITVIVLWVFWPVAIYAALMSKIKGGRSE